MPQESDQNLLQHLQDLEQNEVSQSRTTMRASDGSVLTPSDTLAYPTRLRIAKTPHVESFSNPERFQKHLRMMSGQTGKSPGVWAKNETGGLIAVPNPELGENEEAEAVAYLEEQLVRDNSILSNPHDWMLAYLPAGPYNENGLHVTLIANPREFYESRDRTPRSFYELDETKQCEFLNTTETIFQWCLARFPEEEFVMNVNRGWPKWEEGVGATPQTVQSIHAQIFALPQNQLGFRNVYALHPNDSDQETLNAKALGIRLTRRMLAAHNVLEEFLKDKLPQLALDNQGDAIHIKLGPGNWGNIENCQLIAAVTHQAELVMWMERSASGKGSLGYSWSIDRNNMFRIALSDNGSSTEVLYHTAIIRGSQDPTVRRQVQTGQDTLRATLPKMLSDLEAA